MINVLIIDDEKLVQELFRYYVEEASDRFHFAGVLKSALNAEIVCLKTKVDLILMDICMASGESGLNACAALKKKFPAIKIIIVTSAPELSFIQRAHEAGADSFWYKEYSSEDLIRVMDRTMAGEHVWPQEPPVIKIGMAESTDFTPTEIKVLSYIVQGCSVVEIAQKMGVDYETTRTHIKNLKEKTGASSITALAAMTAKTRLILPEYH